MDIVLYILSRIPFVFSLFLSCAGFSFIIHPWVVLAAPKGSVGFWEFIFWEVLGLFVLILGLNLCRISWAIAT